MKQNLTIVHLIVGLERGGTEMMLLKTLPILNRTNQKHLVINLSSPGPIGPLLSNSGVQVINLDIIHPEKFIPGLLRLLKFLRSLKPNVLTTYFIYSDLIGRIVGPMAGIRVIYCFQRGALLSAEPLRILDYFTKSLVSEYWFVSQSLADRVSDKLHLKPSDIQVIPNGVEQSYFKIRKIFDTKTIIITNIGSFKKKKGQELLIGVLPSLINKYPQLRVVFVGAGPLLPAFKDKITHQHLQDHVKFTGQVNDVKPYLSHTDIFVLTSLEEGMSNALLEAMASSCAVIAHNSSENREVMGQAGILVDITNVSQLEKVLDELLINSERRLQLGKLAQDRVNSHFTITKTIKQLKQLYARN
ncbi:MAG: glycosyltransferase [Desulfobacteraceae bacterium]|jgi:glycosyltransferase involved in cell wall biosynthesis